MMTTSEDAAVPGRRPRRAASAAAILTVVLAVVLAGASGVARAATQIDLRTADSFAVLAGSAITNTGPTTITGDFGLHPGSAVTGFEDVTLDGESHVADAVASQAKDDLVLAYDDAVGQGPATTVATALGGQFLPGGVYDSADGTFQITGTLTLDAMGNPDAVWIFQTASTLITATDSRVVLVNGADACNVFWQVGSSATLGTGTSFAGSILALTSITIDTSARILGRALTRNAAVTMDTNTIARPACSTAPAAGGGTASPSEPATGAGSPTPSEPAAGAGSPTPSEPALATPAPPATATPQVPVVPSGPVAAGDGTTSAEQTRQPAPLLLLLPAIAGLMLFVTWRRRTT